MTATGTVNLSGLLITNGFPGFRLLGGGVQNAGTLNITNCTLTDNFATDGRGGGIANKLGGTVNVINCALNGNNTGNSLGGSISSSGSSTMNITGSVIAANLGGGVINESGATSRNSPVMIQQSAGAFVPLPPSAGAIDDLGPR